MASRAGKQVRPCRMSVPATEVAALGAPEVAEVVTMERTVALTVHARRRLANPKRFGLAPEQQERFIREQMARALTVCAAAGEGCQEWRCPDVVLILRVYNPTMMSLLTCYTPASSYGRSKGWSRKRRGKHHGPAWDEGGYGEHEAQDDAPRRKRKHQKGQPRVRRAEHWQGDEWDAA